MNKIINDFCPLTPRGERQKIWTLVRRQRLWGQIGDLSNGGVLIHRNAKESEDEPEILCATHPRISLKTSVRYSPRHEGLNNLTPADVYFAGGRSSCWSVSASSAEPSSIAA